MNDFIEKLKVRSFSISSLESKLKKHLKRCHDEYALPAVTESIPFKAIYQKTGYTLYWKGDLPFGMGDLQTSNITNLRDNWFRWINIKLLRIEIEPFYRATYIKNPDIEVISTRMHMVGKKEETSRDSMLAYPTSSYGTKWFLRYSL